MKRFLCCIGYCNEKSRRKNYLKNLLRESTRTGDLMIISRDDPSLIRYMAYQKGDCLYLIGNEGTKIVNVIYLKSYIATKVQGTAAYIFGLELMNVGVESTSSYFFYSNSERDIDDWVVSINSSREFGQIDDKYIVLEPIGKGKFSTVYKCIDKVTRVECAVKEIEKAKLTMKEKELLQNEITIIRDLNNKCIAKCIEVIENRTHVYIVMEKINGGELYELLRKRLYFEESEVVYIIYFMLSAIQYLHGLGVMHRDLKPENVLVELNEEKTNVVIVKLADFGLSTIVEPGACIYDACGTPAYVAPEVLRRKGYSLEVDLWSLGVIAFLL